MTYKIESGIPVAPKAGAGRTAKYPWTDMKAGDSFFVPAKKSPPAPPKILTEQGQKFVSRRQGDGYRVWRIK